MSTIKYLIIGLSCWILGTSIGFYVCLNNYQPQVDTLKEIIAEQEIEIAKVKEDAKNNVRLIFAHNDNCTIEGQ